MTPTPAAAERRGILNRITSVTLTVLGLVVVVASYVIVISAFGDPWPGTWPFIFGFGFAAITILVLTRVGLLFALLVGFGVTQCLSDSFFDHQQLGAAAFVVTMTSFYLVVGLFTINAAVGSAYAQDAEEAAMTINELREREGLPPIEDDEPGPAPINRIVVGLSGYAGAGKDTAAAYLVENHGFTRVSFADKIREFALAVDDFVPVVVPGIGDEPDRETWMRLSEFLESQGGDWTVVKKNLEVRRRLQRLGTDAGRTVIGENVWVDAAMTNLPPGNIVFTDLRFPNEYEAIVERPGGVVVRISRPGTEPVNPHVSETALDGHLFHATITNAGSEWELGETLAKFVGAFTGETSLLV